MPTYTLGGTNTASAAAPFSSPPPQKPIPYQVGEIVELHGYSLANGAVWRGKVESASDSDMVIELQDGATVNGLKCLLIRYNEPGLTIKRGPRELALVPEAPCSVCSRKADVGRPCWWCGTPVVAVVKMTLYVVTRGFSVPLGLNNVQQVTLTAGTKIGFDGTTAELHGKMYHAPNLKGAIKAEWMVLA